MRVVIYTRVSSAEQVGGYSLEAQEEQCRQWAATQGYEVVRVFVEPGVSARTDQRPAFQAMIQIVAAGAADAVLIHKSDRIARNLLDWLVYRDRLETAGKKILSVTEPFLNDDSAESRMVAGIIGAVNEFYSANLSREVTKGQSQKAKSGRFPGGRLPIGYTRDLDKNIIIDPKYAPVIAQAFVAFAGGDYTLQSWGEKSKAEGLAKDDNKPFTAPYWQRIFRNRFYIGEFAWRGELYTGDHPPLVNEETFTAVQQLLDERGSGGSRTRHFWLLSGLLWSTVYNKKMSGSLTRGKYGYYRALGPGPEHAIPAADLEARVIELLSNIRGSTNRSQWSLAMRVSDNLGLVVPHLEQPDLKRFLNQVFLPHSICIAPGGSIKEYRLQVGFETC
ncbi:MAG: recombinase family protein [Anaerolineae bacterium]|nr:recombinase family protein [Anaerolineae bacterium]